MRNKNNGAVLIVVLMLLLAIGASGVGALQRGMFSQRISANVQTDALTVQASASVINGLLTEADDQLGGNPFFIDLLTSGEQINCMVSKGFKKTTGLCGADDTFDSTSSSTKDNDGLLSTQAVTRYKNTLPIKGYDVDVLSYHVYETTGVGLLNGENPSYASAQQQVWGYVGIQAEFERQRPISF